MTAIRILCFILLSLQFEYLIIHEEKKSVFFIESIKSINYLNNSLFLILLIYMISTIMILLGEKQKQNHFPINQIKN